MGVALADNPRLLVTPGAATALRAGGVDDRVVTALAGLAGPFSPAVAAFPSVPGEPAEVPRRRVVVTAVGGGPATDPAALAAVTRWLEAQQPPFRPAGVRPGPGGLTIRYPVVQQAAKAAFPRHRSTARPLARSYG